MKPSQMTLGIDASRAEKGQHTGVEFYSINIIKALTTIVPSDWQVVLYSRGGDLSALGELPSNWRVQVIRAPLNRAWTILALSFYFLRHRPDIFFEPSHIMPFFAPKKSVTVVHDTAWRAFPKAYSWKGRIILEQSLCRARKAAKVIVPTEFVKNELLKINFASKRVTVIPHGFDQAAYHPYDPETIAPTLATYNLSRPYFLTVGRIEEKKNIHRLVQVWGISGLASDYDLVLVGKTGFGSEAIIERIKKTPGVRMLGWCSESDMPALYSGATALAFPSLYEGFGIPALQAAACGTPVVASDIGALREILGQAAWYVDPLSTNSIMQGLRAIIKVKEGNNSVIATALTRSREFSWQRASYTTWETIQSLL